MRKLKKKKNKDLRVKKENISRSRKAKKSEKDNGTMSQRLA
jgi:hypothetical protein